MNYCLTHPGKFSCAVDSFLELSFVIFKDAVKDIQRNEFFQILFETCEQLQDDVQIDMTVVREPIWAYLRQHCNSFAAMSANAVFSDIFTLNTVGIMTQELKSLFVIQQNNQSICSSCNNGIVKNTSIFVLYITSSDLLDNPFENYVCEAILPNSNAIYCDFCKQHSGDLSMLQHFVTLPRFLTVELSSSSIDQIFFPLTMDVLGQNYVLKGMVRCINHHFTVAIKDDIYWVYIDDMCVSVRSYTSFQDLLHSHCNGWFFAIYEKYFIEDNNDIQRNSVPNEIVEQNVTDLRGGTLLKNVPINDDTNIETITKSSAIIFYAICFSIVKPCSYWRSDTLDVLVENGTAFFIDTIKNQTCSSELPQNINVYNADININVVSKHKGILLCSSSSSKLFFEKLILQNAAVNTGFLLHFPSLCLGCIFHKSIKSTTFVLIGLNENQRLEIHRLRNKNSLVQTVCDIVMTKLKSIETEYFIKCVLCTCQLNKFEKQKILKCHKSAKQKIGLAIKRKMSYSQVEPAKKKICLDRFHQYYKSEKRKVLINRAEKYKSMDVNAKENLLTACKERYKSMNAKEKQNLLIARAKKYKCMNAKEKQNLLTACAEKYKSMNANEKQRLLTARVDKYKSMDVEEKQKLLAKKIECFQSMKSKDKEKILDKMRKVTRNARQTKATAENDLDCCIRVFQKKIKEGPYYICSVCNRILYRKTVTQLKKNKYTILYVFTGQKSFDNKEYICKTCSSKLLKGQVPCQAVYNKLMVDKVPSELQCLEKLEQILISQRIVFEKIVIMPKGQQKKIKGAICNVPVECAQTCSVLPRPPETSGIIMLKLKRKLDFRGHVYFQAVRPYNILNALNWLRVNNPLYGAITVNIENIDRNLTEVQLESSSENNSEMLIISEASCEKKNTNDENEEEKDDPLNEFRAATTETCLQSVLPDYPIIVERNWSSKSVGNEIFNIAPGENKHPVSFMSDKHCEELAFPVLFPKGRFGYTEERTVNLSPIKYFNARLLHFSGKFAMNPEYLFFAQFLIEQKKVSGSVNIALTKVHGKSVTASQLRSNVQNLQSLVCQDQAYLFLRQIPGTPPLLAKIHV